MHSYLDARRTRRASLVAAGALSLALAGCDLDPEQAPPTMIGGTGTVAGQIFFDANGNGRFDPVGGDTALTGATLTLSQRGDSARVLDTKTAGAGGAFTFENVPVGTHEIRGRVAGTGQPVTCSPVAVTVNPGEQAFASAGLRVSCRIDIAEAERRTQGSIITVGGIVVAAPGVYRPNNLYLQDVTGGMQAFNVPGGTSSGIVEGDSIEITGPLGAFNQELQMSPVNTVRIAARGRAVLAREYTVQEIRAAYTASTQLARPIGELVVVRSVRITGLPAVPTGTAGAGGTDGRIVQRRTATVNDTLALRFDVLQNVQANIDAATPDTRCYDVQGTLGLFGSTPQLKPRRPSDITAVTCPAN